MTQSPLIQSVAAAAEAAVTGADPLALRVHAARTATLLREVGRAAEKGEWRGLRGKVDRYLVSLAPKVVAVLLALRRIGKRKSAKAHDKPNFEEVLETAAQLDPRADCGEPVHVTLLPKGDGDHRPVVSFGLRRLALQLLVKLLLEAILPPSPLEFAAKGRGPARMCDRIREFVEEHGCEWFVAADIKDFFGSLEREEVKKRLPLPGRVTENVILIPDEAELVLHIPKHLQVNGGDDAWEQAVRRGIPQGSPVSNLVASALLGPVLDAATGAKPVVAHVDDIVVGASSEVDAAAIKHALTETLASHPVGPLYLKFADVCSTQHGVCSVGYCVRRRPEIFGGALYAHPSPRSFDRFEARLWQKTLTCAFDEIDEVGQKYAEAWRGSFTSWYKHEGAISLFKLFVEMELSYVKAFRQENGESGAAPK